MRQLIMLICSLFLLSCSQNSESDSKPEKEITPEMLEQSKIAFGNLRFGMSRDAVYDSLQDRVQEVGGQHYTIIPIFCGHQLCGIRFGPMLGDIPEEMFKEQYENFKAVISTKYGEPEPGDYPACKENIRPEQWHIGPKIITLDYICEEDKYMFTPYITHKGLEEEYEKKEKMEIEGGRKSESENF